MTAPVTPEPISAGEIVDAHMDIGKTVTTVALVLMLGVVLYLMLRSDKRAEEDHKRSKAFYEKMTQRGEAAMNGHRAGSYDFDPPKAPSDAQTDSM